MNFGDKPNSEIEFLNMSLLSLVMKYVRKSVVFWWKNWRSPAELANPIRSYQKLLACPEIDGTQVKFCKIEVNFWETYFRNFRTLRWRITPFKKHWVLFSVWRSKATTLVISMATADLLHMAINCPANVYLLLSYGWNLGVVLCKLKHYFQVYLSPISSPIPLPTSHISVIWQDLAVPIVV